MSNAWPADTMYPTALKCLGSGALLVSWVKNLRVPKSIRKEGFGVFRFRV